MKKDLGRTEYPPNHVESPMVSTDLYSFWFSGREEMLRRDDGVGLYLGSSRAGLSGRGR